VAFELSLIVAAPNGPVTQFQRAVLCSIELWPAWIPFRCSFHPNRRCRMITRSPFRVSTFSHMMPLNICKSYIADQPTTWNVSASAFESMGLQTSVTPIGQYSLFILHRLNHACFKYWFTVTRYYIGRRFTDTGSQRLIIIRLRWLGIYRSSFKQWHLS
jgi:hypothetical protein